MHSGANILSIAISEKNHFFVKKIQLLTYLANPSISVALYDSFAVNWKKKLSRSKQSKLFIWQVKPKKNSALSTRFSIHIVIFGGKNLYHFFAVKIERSSKTAAVTKNFCHGNTIRVEVSMVSETF